MLIKVDSTHLKCGFGAGMFESFPEIWGLAPYVQGLVRGLGRAVDEREEETGCGIDMH